MNSGPGWAYRARVKLKKALGKDIFLCNSCKWDWRGACSHPERPNATWCSDYQKKGK